MSKITIESMLTNLEVQEEGIRKIVGQMMKPGEVYLYHFDILAMAVMNRAVSNIFAFTSLIRQENFGTAAAVIRLHLDSLIRLSACWLHENPHQLAQEILSGARLDKLKDKSGRLMTDKYLAEKLTEKHPWVLKVYQETSGYIHLSKKHILLSSEIKDGEKNILVSQISRYDHVNEQQKIEAINCMAEITQIQIGFIKSWNYQKRNPEAVERIQRLDLVKRMSLKRDFTGSEHIVAFLEERLEHFKEYFEHIKSLVALPANNQNYDDAYQHFVKLFDGIPLMATNLNQDMGLIRARPNYDGEIFSNQSEISYHPDFSKVKAGRFNTPGVPLFYGALPVKDSKLNFGLTGCLESCKALIDKKNPVLNQDMTVGFWRLREILPVVNLCIDDKHLLTNIDLKIATAHYLKMLKKHYTKPAYDFIHNFLTFFSGLSREENADENAYYVTSASFAAIRYYYTEVMKVPFAGLIYPSSATEGVGLNIAVVPVAVDHVLLLDQVGTYRFTMNELRDAYTVLPCSDIVNVNDKKFIITNYIKS